MQKEGLKTDDSAKLLKKSKKRSNEKRHKKLGESDTISETNKKECSKKAPSIKKKFKKKKKKNKKLVEKGVDLSTACVKYLNDWKNERNNWKFEKVKQIRLLSCMFDQKKLPDGSFQIFLEYMDKASASMKKLVTSKSSEVINDVEKWNDLSDEDKLSLPKPKNYEGYERAREILQRFQ